jgi:hypothetical protein
VIREALGHPSLLVSRPTRSLVPMTMAPLLWKNHRFALVTVPDDLNLCIEYVVAPEQLNE